NPLKLWPRQCQCNGAKSANNLYANTASSHPNHSSAEPCPNTFETSYPPESEMIVYCESCYLAEVV
ncbi:MAG: hypothetical protein AAB904_00455, partial [Patescibacteria group bacterium]